MCTKYGSLLNGLPDAYELLNAIKIKPVLLILDKRDAESFCLTGHGLNLCMIV